EHDPVEHEAEWYEKQAPEQEQGERDVHRLHLPTRTHADASNRIGSILAGRVFLLPVAPPVTPVAVKPVPGTDAARAEQLRQVVERRSPARPHVLLDPDPASRPKRPKRGLVRGMSPQEQADRIVAHLLQGSGPILLVEPGTMADYYDNTMGATAKAFIQRAKG